jgi:hypothetical protein
MASRLSLHEELCNILGTRNVYFQPPESIKLSYPCIVYSKSDIDTRSANNRIYTSINQYQLTVMDEDPDSEIHEKILSYFQMCRFDRAFASNNLNHKVLTLYY